MSNHRSYSDGDICSLRNVAPSELIIQKNNLVQQETQSTRKIAPSELISLQRGVTVYEPEEIDTILEKLNEIKQTEQVNNIIKGAKLGLTAYQKPPSGIPLSDLSGDLKILTIKLLDFLSNPYSDSLSFGKVRFNNLTNKIYFYSSNDEQEENVLGTVDLSRIKVAVLTDKGLNPLSDNPIANGVVCAKFREIENKLDTKGNVFSILLNAEEPIYPDASGVIDLGQVLREHLDISNKVNLTVYGHQSELMNDQSNSIGTLGYEYDNERLYFWDAGNLEWRLIAETSDLDNFVPTSRTINSKQLSSDITLSASDIGALPSDTHIPNDPVNPDWNANSGLAEILHKPTIPSKVSDLINDSGYLTTFTETDPTVPSWAKASSKPSYSYSEISGTPSLATVATSGSYTDLQNTPTIPTIPTNVSSFNNDAGYLTQHLSLSFPVVSMSPTNRVALIEPNTYYVLGTVGSSTAASNVLTLSFTPDFTRAYNFIGRFTATADNLNLLLPTGIYFDEDVPDIKANKTYEFNILYDSCIIKNITHASS